MTVLILAAERDFSADRMVRALQLREVPAARIDTSWFPRRAVLDAEIRAGRWMGTIEIGDRVIELETVRSVWCRRPSAFRFSTQLSLTERHWCAEEAKFGFGGVLSSLPVLWVNHPSRNADAAYKPLQLVTALRSGLRVPDTLVTNRPESVRRFAAGGETVAKGLGPPSILEEGARRAMFTRRLDETDLRDLRGVETTAHQFQRWVVKAREARLIVVGDRLFAVGIEADSTAGHIDWRSDYPALRYVRLDPPADVVTGVIRYCAELGLAFGAFDFVIQPDGEWIFLECNSAGQYGWLESILSLPITDVLADLLASASA
ncbi:ATP-grasp ribosomal peptide maturase [Actinoalloteichus fjordicus]|uniref:ATP-grasp ribosomal peptide maturase n=1 Tax=Actinoalloteichus fjordicus TaxID=1612552 RepID=A0AAC9PV42_9PSEU|nr:ATP-grasp ribosomal peptide maturase [Actinoalloteichus fjordicus]APU17586.1 ATP-grasp ribosomal peptide maturase [Actinoalloteichus fjordicus]